MTIMEPAGCGALAYPDTPGSEAELRTALKLGDQLHDACVDGRRVAARRAAEVATATGELKALASRPWSYRWRRGRHLRDEQRRMVWRAQNQGESLAALQRRAAEYDVWLRGYPVPDGSAMRHWITARDRTNPGGVPDGVLAYPDAAAFVAEDPARIAHYTGDDPARPKLGGADFGYDWRLELDERRCVYSCWRLSWTPAGEFCAERSTSDATGGRYGHPLERVADHPVWWIATGGRGEERDLPDDDTYDWLISLETHQRERNSLLYAVSELRRHYPQPVRTGVGVASR